MTGRDLQDLIAKGEGPRLEFRTGATQADMIAKIVCGFLNQDGGLLVLGIEDRNRVTGVADAESKLQQLQAELTSLISPNALWSGERVQFEGRDLVLIEVPDGQDKPYVVGGAIYIRREDRIVPANRDEITRLIQRRAQAGQRWERQLAVGAERADLDEQLVLQTMQLAVESQRWQGAADDIGGFLSSFGLIEQGGVTNAGVLLYGRAPSRVLPQARVRLVVMPEGKTGNRYSADKLFESSILQMARQIPEALALQAGSVESRFSDDWQRSDKPKYPATALREGIMNALVHRDYTKNGSIVISVLPDSLRISNPGGLPNHLKPSDLKKSHPSLPRNPDVAHICFLHGLIEKVGRGTQRIVEDCRKANLPQPKWRSSALETELSFFSSVSRMEGGEEELNERQRRILAAVQQAERVRPGEVAKLVGAGVTERTVRSDLQALVDLGLLRRQGRGRSTSYVARKIDAN